MSTKTFDIVAAMDAASGIGKTGVLAWHLPEDMAHFKAVTSKSAPGKTNAVIMGRVTWDSLPAAFKPLPGRLNIVVSRQPALDLPFEVLLCTSLDQALAEANKKKDIDQIFVIGGAKLYETAIVHPQCKALHVTRVENAFDCDVFFPPIPPKFKLQERGDWELSRNGITYQFQTYF